MALHRKAKPARCFSSGGFQENKQLAGQLTTKDTELPTPAQGFQIFLMLWSLAALITASAPR